MEELKEIKLVIPNLGEAEDTEVIELSVKVGDKINKNDPIIVLESEKAAMEVPSDFDGIIKEISVKEGDSVREGMVYAVIESSDSKPVNQDTNQDSLAPDDSSIKDEPKKKFVNKDEPKKNIHDVQSGSLNAGPAVRKVARELDIDLTKIKGTGKNALITKFDLKDYIHSLSKKTEITYADLSALTSFGDCEVTKQTKTRQYGAKNLHISWTTIPHVTHFEEIDITNLESIRKTKNEENKTKITLLSYLVKFCALSLKEFPIFNSSLIAEGNVALRKYINIGIAVDTEDGLVVPVIKDADNLDENTIADQIKSLSIKAKAKKLLKKDMEGATFTISSLGGIGGVGFTPIINPPEVAIIGVSRSKNSITKVNDSFEERSVLPISISYDHRVINGADAGRFMTFLKQHIEEQQ